MIAKIVQKKKATGSFGGLVDYIEDKLSLHSDKVELVYSENCEFDTIEENVKEVKATQALYKGKADPNMHLLVSFQEDEKPTQEQLREITSELLKSINMDHLQRVCATHIDTNNYHLHIAINRIDQDTHKRIDTFQSKRKLDKKMIELEEKLNLKKDNHIPNWLLADQNRKSNNLNQGDINERRDNKSIYTRRSDDTRDYTREQLAVARLQKSNTKQSNKRANANRVELLPELSSVPLVHDIKRTEMLLQRDGDDKLGQTKQSNTDLRRERVSDNSDDRSDEQPAINQKAKDIRSHTGIANLATWIQENALDDIKAILANKESNLEDLHKTFAKYNLEIKERGNGLIIKDKTRNLFCKASDIDRKLSKNSLEKQYGDFFSTKIDIKPTIQFGMPKNDYWDRYKATSEAKQRNKKEQMDKLKENFTKNKKAIQLKYQERRAIIKSRNYNKKIKKDTYKIIFENQKKDMQELYEEFSKQRSLIYKSHKYTTYNDFLITESLKGDDKALEILRKQKTPPKPKKEENTLGGREDNTIFTSLKPIITKIGYVIYKIKNQDKIIDKGNHFKITNADDESILKALEMAQQKYGNYLNITGDDSFKAKVISLTHQNSLNITFKDKNMQETLDALKDRQYSKGNATKKQEKSIE